MAVVTYIPGDCPGCGRKASFGNGDVFGRKVVDQRRQARSYNKQAPLSASSLSTHPR
jgi:hypothetical protein